MKFLYQPWVYTELSRCLRGLFPPNIALTWSPKCEDVMGIDLRYIVNHNTPLQVRVRFDRPPGASDADVTFRTTEPAMMAAGSYAPLAVFVWFEGHQITAAKLIDVYRMAGKLNPPLTDRPVIGNPDRTAFYTVALWELQRIHAVLKVSDGIHWIPHTVKADDRLFDILRAPVLGAV